MNPRLVEYQCKPICFHRGSADKTICWPTLDGEKWSEDVNLRFGSTDGPSAVVFKNKLYLFHKGGTDNNVWMALYDGNRWSSNTKLSFGTGADPASAVFQNKIVLVHRGGRHNKTLWYTPLNGGRWTTDTKACSSTPGLSATRLRRVEELTGRSLSDPRTAADLGAALLAVRDSWARTR